MKNHNGNMIESELRFRMFKLKADQETKRVEAAMRLLEAKEKETGEGKED
jgi:hypothetical protein